MAETPDEQPLTKRQRQKIRRQQKLEAQQAAARAARRRRLTAITVVVVVLVGLVGAVAYGWVTDRLEERDLIAEAEERFDELGCTPVEEQPPPRSSPHFGDAELAQSPPDAVYPDRPATSGPHIGTIARTGVYDKVIDERLLIHNMEHGYAVIYYHEDAPEGEVAELKAFAQEQIDSGRHEKIIVSEWNADLPDDANFAYVAWGARQLCREYDEGVALAFLGDWHYLAGNAPERDLRPHLDQGLDPDAQEGDVLFPPLTEHDAGVDDEMHDDAEDAEDE